MTQNAAESVPRIVLCLAPPTVMLSDVSNSDSTCAAVSFGAPASCVESPFDRFPRDNTVTYPRFEEAVNIGIEHPHTL
jgi:hypothetical protein